MSARVQINLEIKFEESIIEACRKNYKQAIDEGVTEEEALGILSKKIQKEIIDPLFQSKEFKSAYDRPNPSSKKLTFLRLAKMRYQNTADLKIKEIIKAAWQMTIELRDYQKIAT